MLLALKPKDFISIIKVLFDLIDAIKLYCKKIETEIKKLDLLKDYDIHEISTKVDNKNLNYNQETSLTNNHASDINQSKENKQNKE